MGASPCGFKSHLAHNVNLRDTGTLETCAVRSGAVVLKQHFESLQLGGMVVLMAIQHVVGQRLPLLQTGAMERATQPRLDAEVQQVFASLGEEYHELCERLFADDPEFGLRFSEDLAPR